MGDLDRPRRLDGAGAAAAPWHASGPDHTPGPADDVTVRSRYLPRSRRLLDMVTALDSGVTEAEIAHRADEIRRMYAGDRGGLPIGFLARCRLGAPFVDHRLDLAHTVVTHFAAADPVPEPFGAARMLARSQSYAYIEIYSDGLVIPVLRDGSVVHP
ncbi:hypothetical protein [Streptomyces sp. NPDC057287]|uniref:hypothetical protein n=1 Tax=Streptomyces sp. NPDC057287 TaxID=3346086 RepID=UPI0036405794